jgi:hypothetical protein
MKYVGALLEGSNGKKSDTRFHRVFPSRPIRAQRHILTPSAEKFIDFA